MVLIGIKPVPGDLESNFKNLGAILCGCNTEGKGSSLEIYKIACLGILAKIC